jgi:hypothetical protein
MAAQERALPSHLRELLRTLPANVTRRVGAEIITKHVFPISHRSLERWPLPTKFVNGKATAPTIELLAQAWARFSAAPILMSGQRSNAETAEHVATK